MKVVILNGGFGRQLTHDIVVDTISTKLNRKSTDAKASAGGDARRLGSHTHILRGRSGKEYVNPGLVKVNDVTHLEHLYIMLRKCERLYLPRDLFIVGKGLGRVVGLVTCIISRRAPRSNDVETAGTLTISRAFFFFFSTNLLT